MKDRSTTFENMREKEICGPNKLKEHFKAYFHIWSEVVDATELKNA